MTKTDVLWDKAGGARLCPGGTQRSQGKGTTSVDLLTWGHILPQRNHIPFPKIKPIHFFQGEILVTWLIGKDVTWGITLELNECKRWTKELNQSKPGGEVRGAEGRSALLHSFSQPHTAAVVCLQLWNTAGFWKKERCHLSRHGIINHIPEMGRCPDTCVWFRSFSSGPGSSLSSPGLNRNTLFSLGILVFDLQHLVQELGDLSSRFCYTVTHLIADRLSVTPFALSLCFLI